VTSRVHDNIFGVTRLHRSTLTAILCLIATITVQAHPAPFSYLDIHIGPTGVTGTLVVHDFDAAHELGLVEVERLKDPVFVEQRASTLTERLTSRLQLVADGRSLTWTVQRVRPLPDRDAIEFTWAAPLASPIGKLTMTALLFPYDPQHQTFVNVYEFDALRRQEVLSRERTTVDYFAGTRQGLLAVFTTFTLSGIHHIAIGPDHILFIIGLLLLGGSLRRLLLIVTAFTLGHSVTLALATLQIVSPPARLIEPAIALSIVYVGLDNLLAGPAGRDVRAFIALMFGLVHGFGFASVLREIGLPSRALGVSLFSFNLGVEIGQALIVIVVATLLEAIRRRNAPAAQRIVTVGSLVVMLAGAFWFVERLL
jgi:hydrogenase/urease accessory protein HupE